MKKSIVSALALASALPVHAQSNVALPTRDQSGNDVIVTASRSGEGVDAKTLPASVTLLTNEDLSERQTRLVSDILRDVPGVAVNRTVGGLGQVRVRGSESNHVLVLIDGIEASDPFQGEFDFNGLLADEAARIEVLRGQQSSLYGSDAIGGVIHYITLTGSELPGLTLRAEGGSFATAAWGVRLAGVSGALDYAASASAYHTDGFPTARGGSRDVGSTLANATAKLVWSPSGTLKVTGVGRYGYADADANNSESDPTSPLFGYTVDSDGVFSRNRSIYGLVRADLALADGRWNHAATAQFADTTRKNFAAGALDFGNKGRRYKASYETSLRFGTERVVSRLTGAVDFEREEFQNITPSSFVFAGRRSTENWGFVGQYELTIDDALSAGASIRRDENDRFDDVTTYRLQAGYRLPIGLRVRGAYGTGVKNPGYYELFGFSDGRYIGNPNLRPEKSKGWEAGADWDIAQGKAVIGATYFDARLEDEVFTDYPAPAFVATPANRTTVSRQHGIEASLSARPVPQIKFDLSYTWLDATENEADEVRRPRHIGSVNATVFSTDQRFSGTLTVRYNGRQDDLAYTDPSYVPVRVSLQEYVLVNLAAQYKLSDRIALFGRVENLFDERYQEVFSFATAGRGAVGGVRATF
jgi:vitamin B12 transporter